MSCFLNATRYGVFGVGTVNNFCFDGLSNDGARNVKFVTEIDPVPIFIVLTQYFAHVYLH